MNIIVILSVPRKVASFLQTWKETKTKGKLFGPKSHSLCTGGQWDTAPVWSGDPIPSQDGKIHCYHENQHREK